jgi:hypothetical protein
MKNEKINSPYSKFIPDYEYWFNKKNITDDEAFLVVQGVNPDDYRKHTKGNNEQLRKWQPHLIGSEFSNYLNSIYFNDNTKLIKKECIYYNGDLYHLCNELYERCYKGLPDNILPKSLFLFLESKGKKLTHFDHYKNKEQYFVKYDKWLKKDILKNISKEDVLYLFVGLEPKFAKKYKNICEKYNAAPIEENFNGWENEDRFFYEVYVSCCCSFLRYIEEINRISTDDFNYRKEGFFTFVQELYNAGYVPCDELGDYLKKIGKKLEYSKESKVYKLFDKYRERPFWSLEELRCLVCGMDPDTGNDWVEKTKLITFFNNQSNNYSFFTNTRLSTSSMIHMGQDEGRNEPVKFKIKLSENKPSVDDYECYLGGLDIVKNDHRYDAKALLQNIIDDTIIKPPELLIKMVLGEQSEAKEGKMESEVNSQTMEVGTNLNMIIKISMEKLYEIKWKVANTAEEKTMSKSTFQNLVSGLQKEIFPKNS